MADKTLKLLLVCAALTAVLATPPLWKRTRTTEETDVFMYGKFLHETREIDRNCRHATTTVASDEGFTSDEDFDTRIQVIQFPRYPDTCFVRVIPREQSQQGACATNRGEVSETLTVGCEFPFQLLSEEQQKQCQGKKVLSLVPESHTDANAVSADHTGARLKRQSNGGTTIKINVKQEDDGSVTITITIPPQQ